MDFCVERSVQILPVLDVLDGTVVRGVGGRRAEYRRIASRLTPSSQPVEVARALASHFGFEEFYLADLDAIMGQEPSLAVYRDLHKEGFRLWVDAGLRTSDDARTIRAAGVATLVAGLETLAGPEVLERLCAEHGSERLVFSLDMKAGVLLGNKEAWSSNDPLEIARLAIAMGIRRLLVLDLASVGTGAGTGTEQLCRQLVAAHPHVRIAAGGGIADMADVRRLNASGVETVLVASALHDGRISKAGMEN